jgi:predicted nucleic acid-binding protein
LRSYAPGVWGGQIRFSCCEAVFLAAAGLLLPAELRTLDAIHLATAQQLKADLARLVTYDERRSAAADAIGWPVVAPN